MITLLGNDGWIFYKNLVYCHIQKQEKHFGRFFSAPISRVWLIPKGLFSDAYFSWFLILFVEKMMIFFLVNDPSDKYFGLIS